MRKNSNIKGISINDKTAIISQYADDATFFLRDVPSLEHLLDLLAVFSLFSGLLINVHKSHLLLLGNFKDPPSSVRGIQSVAHVKILGMIYKTHMQEDEHYELNSKTRILKIKKICETWINRSLSMKGKVVLINSLMLSILQYPSSTTFTPTRVLFEVKRLITDFLLNNSRSKIAYNLLIQDTRTYV